VRANASGTPIGFNAVEGFLLVVILRKDLDFVKSQRISVSEAAVLAWTNEFFTFKE
jgi:hypothetical protein